MIDILLKYGFVYHHGCHCGGTVKRYYRKGDYEVLIMPNRKCWTLRKSAKTIVKGMEGELEDALKNIYDKKTD